MKIHAPAKINLFLSVGPPDTRGYHPLRTIFQAVSLFDTIEIEETNQPAHDVRFNEPDIPPDNTVTKCLRLIEQTTQIPKLRIRVEKKIPMEAGLGGGSSDAAAVLRAVASLSNIDPKPLAASIGADVPYFLVGGLASAEGYGESLTPLDDAPTRWLTIAKPSGGCPTPQMFQELDAIRRVWREFPEDDILYNDFERVMPPECGDLICRLLEHDADDAGLTGSGSAVFGRFPDKSTADKATRKLRERGVPFVETVRTLSRSECLETTDRKM